MIISYVIVAITIILTIIFIINTFRNAGWQGVLPATVMTMHYLIIGFLWNSGAFALGAGSIISFFLFAFFAGLLDVLAL